MLARIKKIGHSLHKAGKSVEEGFGKAGRSMTKSVDAASRSHGSKSKGKDAAKGATADTSTETPAANSTASDPRPASAAPTPSEHGTENKKSRPLTPELADKAHSKEEGKEVSTKLEGEKFSRTPPSLTAVRASVSSTPKLSPAAKESATPPRSSSANASVIQFVLEPEENVAPAVSQPPPPPRPPRSIPPNVPKVRGDGKERSSDTPVSWKQVRVTSPRASRCTSPAESNRHVHSSDHAGLQRSNSSVAGSIRSFEEATSSIRFEVNTTGNTTANASPLQLHSSQPQGRKAKGNDGLVSKDSTSITFEVVGGGEQGEAESPLFLEKTVHLKEVVDTDAADVALVEDRGDKEVHVESPSEDVEKNTASGGEAATSLKETLELDNAAAGREADDKQSKEKKSKRRKQKEDKRDDQSNDSDDADRAAKRASSRKKRRKSSKADHTEDDDENSDGGKRKTRGKRRSASTRRRKQVSPPPSPSPSPTQSRSRSSASAATGSSSSTELRVDRERRKTVKRSDSRRKQEGAAPQSARGTKEADSRRQQPVKDGRRAHSAASDGSYRSRNSSRAPAEVSKDVRKIFSQCRLDAKSIAQPQRRRRVASPPGREEPYSEPRSRSAVRRASVYDSNGFYVPGHCDSRRQSRSGSARGDRAGRHRSPRGRHGGGRHGQLAVYQNGADGYSSRGSSSAESYVSYNAGQRELYRGRPREVRRRPSPSRLAASSALRRRPLSPSDWRLPPNGSGRDAALVTSFTAGGQSPRRLSPGRQRQPRDRTPSASSASRGYYSVEPSPMRRSTRYAPPTPVEYRVVRQQLSHPRRSASAPSSSVEDSLVNEDAILEEVDFKLEVLAEQIAYNDFALEQDMMSSPFERLYHMNNQRDRSERRKLLSQFNKLQAIREKIISGTLDREIAEREDRQRQLEEKLRDPNGVYMRLYQSPRRRGAELEAALAGKSGDANKARQGSANNSFRGSRARGGVDGVSVSSSRAVSPSVGDGSTGRQHSRGRTKAEQEAYFNNIYQNAMDSMQRRREAAEAAKKEREQQEQEDLLVAKLAGRMQRASQPQPTRAMSPDEILAQARERIRAEKQKGNGVAAGVDSLLQDRRLTRDEERRMANRLTRQGLRNNAKLEAKRLEQERSKCTFKPKVNDYRPAAYGTGHEDGEDSEEDQEERSSDRSRSSRERHGALRGDKFEELYRKGMAAKQRASDLQAQKDRELRLRILKSRLSDDHHFRKRVELDPSLAERFMRSLEV